MKQSLTVRWKKYDSSEYYSYNPETGILYILVNLPEQKGSLVRTDANAGELMRQYHKEINEGVPAEHRLFAECTNTEYTDVITKVTDFTANAFRTTFHETF